MPVSVSVAGRSMVKINSPPEKPQPVLARKDMSIPSLLAPWGGRAPDAPASCFFKKPVETQTWGRSEEVAEKNLEPSAPA